MYICINKLGSRSYSYIHLKSSYFCVIHLVLERCCFGVVLPKKRLRPLGVNLPSKGSISSIQANFKHTRMGHGKATKK